MITVDRAPPIHSPYGVSAHSVVDRPTLTKQDALAPFEQDQLARLIAQLDASPQRIRSAFLKHIRADRRKYRT